jgi:hypothetical protein
MPWKCRGGRRYWYSTERVGGRVVSRYVGPEGTGTELIAAIVRGRAALADAERSDERARARREAERERPLEEAVRRVERLVTWALIAAGYHRPRRNDWRKRMTSTNTPATIAEGAPPPSPLELTGKLERALAGRMVDFESGDGDPKGTKGIVAAEVLTFAAELAGPEPAPIVRAAAHVAAIAYYDWIISRWLAHSAVPKVSEARAIERAEKRFHRAAKSLHAIQRRLPDVLIAIGQVNIGGG